MARNSISAQLNKLLPPPADRLIAEHTVRGFEVGIEGNLKFTCCLNYLQDAAERDAARLNVGLADLQARGLLWVLSRLRVELSTYPMIGDTVQVYSWPAGWDRLFAIREFILTDPSGKLFGRASSAWLVLKSESFRPVRPHDHLPEIPLLNRRDVELDTHHLPALEQPNFSRDFAVRMHDLDVNRHVNNAVYAEWALESLPPDIWATFRPYELDAQFIGMAFPGQSCRAQARCIHRAADRADFHHSISRPSDGRELTRLISRWASLPTHR